MNNCFTELSINLSPFSKTVTELLTDKWPSGRMDKLHSINELNPELLVFFKDNNVEIRDTFLLINWWVHRPRPAHTDGNWFSRDEVIAKRQCGINWSFTPGSWVDFYSTENATPYFDPKGRIDDATTWPNVKDIVARWETPGPVIFNPQIPHRVNSLPNIPRRVSCTLRFVETYESLVSKLSKYII
jgi:hypothetical protein